MDTVKVVGDVVAVSATLGALLQWLPAVSAALTIVWVLIRIYETKTVQKWLTRGVQELADDDD